MVEKPEVTEPCGCGLPTPHQPRPRLTPRGNTYIVPVRRGVMRRARKRAVERRVASLARCRLACGALLWPEEVDDHRCDKPTIGDWAGVRRTSVFDDAP